MTKGKRKLRPLEREILLVLLTKGEGSTGGSGQGQMLKMERQGWVLFRKNSRISSDRIGGLIWKITPAGALKLMEAV